jgi:hypothetical protein
MANTRRESTTRARSENASDSAGWRPVPALGFGLHLFTPVHAVCQEFNHLRLPIREPMISCIAGAVDIAYDSHAKTNGSTVSLSHGNMVGQKLFAVSPYPDRTVELPTRPTWQQLFSFALANADLLLKPAHALGSCFNEWKLKHELDVVVLSSDRDAALARGLRAGQRSIFNLEERREIAVPSPTQASTVTLAEAVNE